MSMKTAFAATIAGVMLAAGPATIATAQEGQAQSNPDSNGMQMAPAEAPSPDDFSDDQVDLFAEAYIEVRQIGMSYNQPIQQAADEQERRALIQEAQTEMVAVIEDIDGLSVDDYNGINAAAQADQTFAEELQSEITDVSGAEGGMESESQ